MKAQRKEDLVQAAILAGFAFLLFNLLSTGKIVLFINPRLAWLIGLASALLGIIAIAKLIPRYDHGQTCACEHAGHSLITGNIHLAVLFLLPLVLGFLMQPRVLGSAALTNSINIAGPVPFYAGPLAGLNNNSADLLAGIMDLARGLGPVGTGTEGAPEASQTNSPVQTTDTFETAVGPIEDTDLVQLDVKIYENQKQLSNRHFRLTGFVYKDSNLGKNQFVIARFVVVCCLLDTIPIGIIAESPTASDLKADNWVEAEGTLKMRGTFSAADQIEPVLNFHGPNTDFPFLVITSLKKVPAPKDPYLYSPQ